jgi:hypothetical protein
VLGPCLRGAARFSVAQSVMPLINARDPAATAADVVQYASVTSRHIPKRCGPVTTVRRKSCTLQDSSDGGVASILARTSMIALSSARFDFDQLAKLCGGSSSSRKYELESGQHLSL